MAQWACQCVRGRTDNAGHGRAGARIALPGLRWRRFARGLPQRFPGRAAVCRRVTRYVTCVAGPGTNQDRSGPWRWRPARARGGGARCGRCSAAGGTRYVARNTAGASRNPTPGPRTAGPCRGSKPAPHKALRAFAAGMANPAAEPRRRLARTLPLQVDAGRSHRWPCWPRGHAPARRTQPGAPCRWGGTTINGGHRGH